MSETLYIGVVFIDALRCSICSQPCRCVLKTLSFKVRFRRLVTVYNEVFVFVFVFGIILQRNPVILFDEYISAIQHDVVLIHFQVVHRWDILIIVDERTGSINAAILSIRVIYFI